MRWRRSIPEDLFTSLLQACSLVLVASAISAVNAISSSGNAEAVADVDANGAVLVHDSRWRPNSLAPEDVMQQGHRAPSQATAAEGRSAGHLLRQERRSTPPEASIPPSNFSSRKVGRQVAGNATLLQDSASVVANASFAVHDAMAEWQGMSSQVQAASALNPLSAFTFVSTDQWTLWPGLTKEINLYSDCVVLAHYQTAVASSNTHMLTRMLLDSQDIVGSRSAQGNTKYSSNFGIFLDHLSAGRHVFEVQYRTAATNTKFEEGGMDWMTRSLNILALPEAQVNDVTPRWPFKLSSADLWSEWQGFRQEMDFDKAVPTLGIYTAVVEGKNSFLASKIYLDGHEVKESRSVAGDTTFAQNTGFFAREVKPGKHSWTVKYRTKSRDNFFKDNAWMARSLKIVTLPGAEMWTVFDDTEFNTENDGTYKPLKGLQKQVNLTSDRYVLVMYSVAMQSHTEEVASASVKSMLKVNDVEQKQSRARCGISKYCQLNGMWMGVLPAGTHDMTVMYSTNSLLSMKEGLDDYMNRGLFVVALSTVSSAISLLQENEQIEPAGTDGSPSSFIDLASKLQGLTEMEKQVRAGTAPDHIMTGLRAAGALDELEKDT